MDVTRGRRAAALFQAVDGLARGEQAAAEGWDAPWLAPALRGETPAGALTLAPESAELISLRLAVLERRGRAEAALSLAVASGDVAAQTRLLVRLGRGAEAVQVGLAQLRTAEEALDLGRALQHQGDVAAALASRRPQASSA